MAISLGIENVGSDAVPDGSINQSKIVANAIVTDHITDSAVTNAKIPASAGIPYSKLNLAGAVAETDLDATQLHTRKFLYDFAAQGGAAGAKTLTSVAGAALTIPAYSVIRTAAYRFITPPDGTAGATVALGYTGAATGFLTATLLGSFLSADVLLDPSASPTVIGASAVSVLATIAVHDLTAGKLVLWVEYYPGSATL